MKTKNHLLICLFALVLLSFPSAASSITPAPTSSEYNAEAQKLVNRLEEIKAMDTKNMTRSEKRELRREVKRIEKRLSTASGVYVSVGALLIIILLLILLI
jgi:predicted PurR-regulated permease PerM